MDLNTFDGSYDDLDDYPTPPRTTNPFTSFTQLLSDDIQNNEFIDVDDIDDPMSLSQLSTQNIVFNTPISNTECHKKHLNSKSKQCNQIGVRDARKWSSKEDVALMSAWCMCSTDSIVGTNQNTTTIWNRIKDLYEQSIIENNIEVEPNSRTVQALKGRYKRLSFLVNKWVGFYKQVLGRPKASGTNIDDDIEAAQVLFRKANNNKDFDEFDVFNNVMSKHHKWSLQTNNFGITQKSGSSSKRSRTESESSPSNYKDSNPSPSSVNEDMNIRPEGREVAKNSKGKGKSQRMSMFSDDDLSFIEGQKLDNKTQIEHGERRIEADFKLEDKRLEHNTKLMEMKFLNTLMKKQHLNPEQSSIFNVLKKKFLPQVPDV